jgi:predicted dehydrogenase
MRKVTIGFAGCGMVSELHAAAIDRSRTATLAGVYDPDTDLALRRAKTWGCPVYDSYEALVSDETIDAVYVLTPTATHVEAAVQAIEAGKHVLVEKPVGQNMTELERLLEHANQAATVCMPGHNYAYVPELQRIRRLVREGLLGEIRFAAVLFAIPHDEQVASHYNGALRLVMPHHAYILNGLFGVPQSVYAGITEPSWKMLRQEDQCWITMEYAPRTTALLFATLAVGDASADPWTFVVKVLGTHGSASATWSGGVFQRAMGSIATGYAAYEEAYERELEAFCRAVAGDREAIISPLEDAIDVERILTAAEEAVRTRCAVELNS